MRNLQFVILLVIISISNGICQNLSSLDSIIFYGNGGYHYAWSSEHVSDQIFIAKDTNLFTHQFRQHLLVENYYGVYKLKEDTLYLECTMNCNSDLRRINLGPIVIPMNDDRYKDTVIISRADGSQDYLSGQLIKKSDKDSLIINDRGKIYIEVVDSLANYYIVKIDYDFKLYDDGINKYKYGVIQGNKMIMDNKLYNRTEYPPYIKPEEKKKKRKKCKANQ